MAKYFEDNKITYQQLVMEQIKIIQNIASKELRNATKTIKNLVGEQTIEAEDTRLAFLQAVEMLGSLLSPYFGKSSINKEFEDFCILYDIELIDAIKDKDFVDEIKLFFNDDKIKETIISNEDIRKDVNLYLLNSKIKDARRMFRLLVQLFKANNFLSSESFSEGSDDNDSLTMIDDTEGDDEIS